MAKKSTKSKGKESKQSKKTSEKKSKSIFKNKKILLVIPVAIILIIIGFVWLTITPEVAKAQLIIESGTVQIKTEGGSWIPAQNGTLLYQSDTIKTGRNTSVSIVLFKSSIIRLDSNTEVTINEILEQDGETHVKIQQDIGRTWNSISKLSGIDNYEVQTPTTIASVRGTSFDVNVTANGKTDIGVENGTVNVSSVQNGTVIDAIEVNENESVTVDPDLMNETLETKPFEKDDWVKQNKEKDKELKENLKDELYKRIGPYIPELKERYGMTDEELDVLIDGYLNGYLDLPPDTPDWLREIIEGS